MTDSFARSLAEYGPEAVFLTPDVDGAFAYCARLARSHYENFAVASFLLPKAYRKPFYAIYAYCRWADDLGDETGGGERAVALLDWWGRELDRCFDSAPPEPSRMEPSRTGPSPSGPDERPVHPVFVALRETVREHSLPREPFADLLTAFRRDQTQHRYETLDDLLDYCRYSANPVGRIILHLAASVAGRKPPGTRELGWSDSICTGLQLANHWQDISRDRVIGRCYVPAEIARRFGVDPDRLLDAAPPEPDAPRFLELVRFLIDDAESRLLAGRPLVRHVPRSLRLDIRLFLGGGLAILREIRRRGYAVQMKRPRLSAFRKFQILLAALFRFF